MYVEKFDLYNASAEMESSPSMVKILGEYGDGGLALDVLVSAAAARRGERWRDEAEKKGKRTLPTGGRGSAGGVAVMILRGRKGAGFCFVLQFDQSRQPFSKEGVVLLESLCIG